MPFGRIERSTPFTRSMFLCVVDVCTGNELKTFRAYSKPVERSGGILPLGFFFHSGRLKKHNFHVF